MHIEHTKLTRRHAAAIQLKQATGFTNVHKTVARKWSRISLPREAQSRQPVVEQHFREFKLHWINTSMLIKPVAFCIDGVKTDLIHPIQNSWANTPLNTNTSRYATPHRFWDIYQLHRINNNMFEELVSHALCRVQPQHLAQHRNVATKPTDDTHHVHVNSMQFTHSSSSRSNQSHDA